LPATLPTGDAAAMTFREAEAYLLSTINETVSPREPYRLERMRAFLRELGDPQERYPTVHVGGTSGKGSTSLMIAAALEASGRRTGLHTKPHLTSPVERARVDGANVAPERFAQLLASMMPAIERVAARHGRPSYYETLLALAFTHFWEERVDVAVIEVGLGGALDGTNVLQRPQVCVITTVGFDHTDVLGDTLEEIAAEKAGIAKPGVPLVVGVERPEPLAVIAARAAGAGAPLFLVDDFARVLERPQREPDAGQTFAVATPLATYELQTAALGAFQRRNAATAIAALERLREGLRPGVAAVEAGFARLDVPGRMEVVPGNPAIVFDIAHNAEKAERFVAALRERFPNRPFRFVVAIGASKDAREIVRTFAGVASHFAFTRFETVGRVAADPEDLARIGASLGVESEAEANPRTAFAKALREASPEGVVVVTGSTFVVAELRAIHV